MDNGFAIFVVGVLTLLGVGVGIYRQEMIAKASRLHDQRMQELNAAEEAARKVQQTYTSVKYLQDLAKTANKETIGTIAMQVAEKSSEAITGMTQLAGIGDAMEDPVLDSTMKNFISKVDGSMTFSEEESRALHMMMLEIHQRIAYLKRLAASS